MLTKFFNLFRKKEKEAQMASLPIEEPQPPPLAIEENESTFSFTNDDSLKFGSMSDAIPELKQMLDRFNQDKILTFQDLVIFFKYFESGFSLNSNVFKFKEEVIDNTLFSIVNAGIIVNNNRDIIGLNLVVKEMITGLNIHLEAPTSFFTEFTKSVEMPKQTVH